MSNEKNSEKSKVNSEKMKALDAVLLQIEKHYGKGAIMKLGDAAGSVDIEVIPTGCLSLDIALGIGGIPRGRIVEIYGPESSGKPTVALHIIAEAQKAGGEAAFIDAEHALDPRYAKKLGVNINDLLDELIAQSVALVGKPVALMNKDDKVRAIRFLNESGAFLVTKSGDKVAKYFGISKYTLYSYIDANKDGDK